MSTILIHVRDLEAQGFPEEFCVDDGQDPQWLEHPRDTALIPTNALPPHTGPMDDTTPAAHLRSTGRDLFNALLPDPIRGLWQAEMNVQDSRVVLDIEPSALRPLPWELLCTPGPQERWLFDDETHPCVRAHLPFALKTEPLSGPVRLLVVVGDPDDPALHSDGELEAIYRGLSTVPCCWQVHVLRAPGMEKTRGVLTEFAPHILHFIGHGRQVEAEPTLEIMASPPTVVPERRLHRGSARRAAAARGAERLPDDGRGSPRIGLGTR